MKILKIFFYSSKLDTIFAAKLDRLSTVKLSSTPIKPDIENEKLKCLVKVHKNQYKYIKTIIWQSEQTDTTILLIVPLFRINEPTFKIEDEILKEDILTFKFHE
jgi:hypothetical protein